MHELPPLNADTLPPPVRDASAWTGREMAARTDWIEVLDTEEIAEIEAATRALLARGADLGVLQSRDFPLPTLGPRLQRLLHELLEGRGFVLLRGLPLDRWPRRFAAVAFLGLGTHLGGMCMQNAAGHLLGHVRDVGLASTDPNVRIYQTHERQTFHTDSCDIVGLLCLQGARAGGLSALVSSATIYNRLRAARPDLAARLFEPLATDRRGEIPPGCKPYFEIPVFNWHDGKLSAIYQRQYIDSAQRFADAPRLDAQQVEALDHFDALANDPELMFTMALQPGDMQFVHNHNLLHDRTAFDDWPEPERRRHLLRLWLAPEGARRLPAVYAQRYGSVEPGQRGGIRLAGAKPTVPLDEV